jgi:WD40 repeat protein
MSGEVVTLLRQEAPITALDLACSTNQLVIGTAAGAVDRLIVWSLSQGRAERASRPNDISPSDDIVAAVLWPDGKSIRFVDTEGDQPLRELSLVDDSIDTISSVARDCAAITVDRERRRMAVSGDHVELIDGRTTVWSRPTTINPSGLPTQRACLSPDGELLYVSSDNPAGVDVIDVRTGNTSRTFAGGSAEVGGYAISGDGRYLAALDLWARGVYLWDTDTGEQLLLDILGSNADGYSSVAISAATGQIALGMLSGYVEVIRLADGENLSAELLHTGTVSALQFSQSGEILISAGEDGKVVLWPQAAH